MRKSYVQIDGVLYERGTEPRQDLQAGPTIIRDTPDFISHIDGTVVHGNAGIREHCARHNVVLTAELKGLPAQRPVTKLSKAERIEDIKAAMIRKGYW